VPKSGGREPAVVCGTRSVSIRFCSAPSRLKIENGGPCSTSARQRSQRFRLPHCYAEKEGHSSTSARQCSQRLWVEFGRTDCRLGTSDRLSAHPKENTGRIGTDRLQGRWPLASFALAVCRLRIGFARTDFRLGASDRPSAHSKGEYGSNWHGRIPGAQTLYARSSWSSRSQVEFPRAAKKAKCSGDKAGRFVFVTRDQRYQARRRSQR
jgi:hypothetical protein